MRVALIVAVLALATCVSAVTPSSSSRSGSSLSASSSGSSSGSASASSSAATGFRFELFKGKDNQFYFHTKAGNNKITGQSEGYASLANAKDGIVAAIVACADKSNWETKKAVNGEPYPLCKADNNKVVLSGETYEQQGGVDKNIASNSDGIRDFVKTNLHGLNVAGANADNGDVVLNIPVENGIFQTVKSKAAQPFHNVFKGKNNEKVFWSENYAARDGSDTGLAAMVINGGAIASFESVGSNFVRIKSNANGKIIARTESYEAKAGMSNAKDLLQTASRGLLRQIAEKVAVVERGSSSSSGSGSGSSSSSGSGSGSKKF